MSLRLPLDLEAELRLAAEEDHRDANQTVLHAIEMYLARRETAEVKADPESLRALAEAREAAIAGDVAYGVEAARTLLQGRRVT